MDDDDDDASNCDCVYISLCFALDDLASINRAIELVRGEMLLVVGCDDDNDDDRGIALFILINVAVVKAEARSPLLGCIDVEYTADEWVYLYR